MKVLFVSSGNITEFKIIPFIEAQADSLKKAGIEVDHFLIKGKGILGYLKNLRSLKHKIKTGNYDILHAHYSYSAWLCLLTFHKTPIVLSLMGGDTYGDPIEGGKRNFKSYLMIFQSQLIQLFIKEIIVKSENLLDYIWNKKKCHLIPNGVDFEKFKPIEKKECREKLNLPLKKKIVLFLGDTRNPRKNFESANDAINSFSKDEILFLHPYPVQHNQIPLYLNACDILLFTSYYEGSPNVIKEALACNTKIVANDCGDISNHLQYSNSLWIAKREKEDIISNIKKGFEFNSAINSRDNTFEIISEQIIAKKIKLIYQKILS